VWVDQKSLKGRMVIVIIFVVCGGCKTRPTAGSAGSGGTEGADVGHPGTDFVAAGQVSEGGAHEAVVTVGTAAPPVMVMRSKRYELKSGIIGATGSMR
jgi:hypothetical protein